MKLIVCFFIIFISISCTQKIKNYNQNSIAQIGNVTITDEELDGSIKQELYDELSRIYMIRQVALGYMVKDKLMFLEAQKQNLSIPKLKEKIYSNKITSECLENFAKANHMDVVPEFRETIIYHNIKSSKGIEVLTQKYKDYLIDKFIDSLRIIYPVTINLKPPYPPKVNIDNPVVHYQGNEKSKVTFLLISDFDCHMCREENPIFEKMYSKYKNKVRFGFTHYGSYVSNSAIASECAGNQGKFWEMHDSIFNAKIIPDSVALFRMAGNLNLDMNTFSNDYKNKAISDRIKNNLLMLESAGIYGTPTIMINNRLIFNSTSLNEIEQMLNEELEKVK